MEGSWNYSSSSSMRSTHPRRWSSRFMSLVLMSVTDVVNGRVEAGSDENAASAAPLAAPSVASAPGSRGGDAASGGRCTCCVGRVVVLPPPPRLPLPGGGHDGRLLLLVVVAWGSRANETASGGARKPRTATPSALRLCLWCIFAAPVVRRHERRVQQVSQSVIQKIRKIVSQSASQ